MKEGYTGLQFTRDFYHHCKIGKPKDELRQHLKGWQEDHPEMGIVVDPDIISVDLEYTESDSNAVPLMEKPVEIPKTGAELAKLITVFQAEGKDVLPIVNQAETQWRKEGEKPR